MLNRFGWINSMLFGDVPYWRQLSWNIQVKLADQSKILKGIRETSQNNDISRKYSIPTKTLSVNPDISVLLPRYTPSVKLTPLVKIF